MIEESDNSIIKIRISKTNIKEFKDKILPSIIFWASLHYKLSHNLHYFYLTFSNFYEGCSTINKETNY